MPFFRSGDMLIYYAHVPKCGGSSISSYLRDRFGQIAFQNNRYLDLPVEQRWTQSSPQHVDTLSLKALIPLTMFDGIFTIVRHPVARAVSTYHFQLEVEGTVPVEVSFSDWLEKLEVKHENSPFFYDNHIRPMTDIVPEGATVFHMEHGLDSLIPWLDLLTAKTTGPRAILPENSRGAHVKTTTARVEPSRGDVDRIAILYAADFKRFGYDPYQPLPLASAPVLDADFLAARNNALVAAKRPIARLQRKIRQRLKW